MKKGLIITALIVFIATCCTIAFWPPARIAWNTYMEKLHRIDDLTTYGAGKKVEDTCRAMMASYSADNLTYEQYKDSSDPEKQGWSEQAKMRANKTASSYNNYILKNSYVWEGNIPADIATELPYIE